MSEISKATWDRAIEAMRHAGREDGLNAAEWWEQDNVGGRATTDTMWTARKLLDGIEDGDPEIMDGLPYLDLSGQWADGPDPEVIYRDATSDIEEMPDWLDMGPERDELIDAYRDAYDERMRDRINELCRAHIDNERDRELTFDEANAAGLDATGRDGDPRFPYHLSDLKETGK